MSDEQYEYLKTLTDRQIISAWSFSGHFITDLNLLLAFAKEFQRRNLTEKINKCAGVRNLIENQ